MVDRVPSGPVQRSLRHRAHLTYLLPSLVFASSQSWCRFVRHMNGFRPAAFSIVSAPYRCAVTVPLQGGPCADIGMTAGIAACPGAALVGRHREYTQGYAREAEDHSRRGSLAAVLPRLRWLLCG